MTEGSQPIEVFCSYAHKDEVWLRKLIIHLRFLEHERSLLIWHDRLLKGGMDWAHEIDDRLNHSRLILLLISPDFVASDYCYGIEMRRALERHEANEARVVPILVRPVGNWQNAPFAYLQALPPGKFLVEWSEREEDIPFAQIANGIHEILKDLPTQFVSVPHANQPVIWNIPYPRNPFFIGREELLSRLHQQLKTGQATALSQPQAISGLGGIGKTQIAVEYAFQHYQDYQAVLWTLADTRESLVSGYIAIAKLLSLPQKDEQDLPIIIDAVLLWFKIHTHWLLILDSADDLAMVREFLPSVFGGHILLTTRAQAMGRLASHVEVDILPQDVGALFLLRRALLLASDADLEHANAIEVARAKELCEVLGGLPLALDQAGAYIEETQCGLLHYLQRYRTSQVALLKRRGGLVPDHPEPVAKTWQLSFQQIKEKWPASAELLYLCAFLDSDSIPEELLIAGAPKLGPILSKLVGDPLKLDSVLEPLYLYSLVRRSPEIHSLNMHRLVQAVLRQNLPLTLQKQWAKRVLRTLNHTFPAVDITNWTRCQLLLPQVQVCVQLFDEHSLFLPEAGHLFQLAGNYAYNRALYAQAEIFFQRSLTVYERVFSPEHLYTAAGLHHLGELYRVWGHYKEAEPLFLRALAIYKQSLPPDHLDVAYTLNNLGELYHNLGRYEEAEPLFLQALSITKRIGGPDHQATLTTLHHLARLYHSQYRYEEAERIYNQVLNAHTTDQVETAVILNNLAILYRTQGHHEQAKALLLRSLKIEEELLGPDHPHTAIALQNLGVVYQKQKQYEEAEVTFQRALAIKEVALGSEHLSTVKTVTNLAYLYRVQKRYPEAKVLFQRALGSDLGREHPYIAVILRNLARLYHEEGNYEEAEALYLRALAISEIFLPIDFSNMKIVLGYLTELYRTLGRNEEAASAEQRKIALQTQPPL